jgi:hypothetical protein
MFSKKVGVGRNPVRIGDDIVVGKQQERRPGHSQAEVFGGALAQLRLSRRPEPGIPRTQTGQNFARMILRCVIDDHDFERA